MTSPRHRTRSAPHRSSGLTGTAGGDSTQNPVIRQTCQLLKNVGRKWVNRASSANMTQKPENWRREWEAGGKRSHARGDHRDEARDPWTLKLPIAELTRPNSSELGTKRNGSIDRRLPAALLARRIGVTV